MFLKNVKAKTLWIITAIIFVITVGLIVLCSFVPTEYTRVVIIGMVIGFISLTFLVQAASFKSFKYKPKKEPANPKTFITELNLTEVLKKNKYKARERSYGISYLKIAKPNAFKVSIITNPDSYFNPEEQDNTEGDPELNKCDRMIGFEVFMNIQEEDKERLADYSIQGSNIYYTSYYYNDNNEYICPNYIEPDEVHKKNYEALMTELGLKERQKEE